MTVVTTTVVVVVVVVVVAVVFVIVVVVVVVVVDVDYSTTRVMAVLLRAPLLSHSNSNISMYGGNA